MMMFILQKTCAAGSFSCHIKILDGEKRSPNESHDMGYDLNFYSLFDLLI